MSNIISFVRLIDWLHFMEHGWGNGYVAISPNHFLYDKDIQNIMHEDEFYLHGGITYDEVVSSKDFLCSEYHIPENYRVIGFDTCHYGDNLRNWPKSAVIKETERLKKWIEKYN